MESGHAHRQNSAHSNQLARPESHSGHIDVDLFAQWLGQLDDAPRSECENLSDRQAALPQLGLERQGQLAVVGDLFLHSHWLGFDIQQHLAELILRGDDLGIRLIAALINDQVGEFPGQIHVG